MDPEHDDWDKFNFLGFLFDVHVSFGGVAGRIFQPAVSVYYWTLWCQILLSDEASGGGMVGKSEVKYLALKDTLSSDQTRSKPCLTIYLHLYSYISLLLFLFDLPKFLNALMLYPHTPGSRSWGSLQGSLVATEISTLFHCSQQRHLTKLPP